METTAGSQVGSQIAGARPSLGTTILRNTIALFTGGLAIKGLNFAFNIFVVRLLGEAGLGQYASVTAFVGMFGVFFELGLAQYVQRSIAQDRSKTQELFWNLVALRLILACGGVVAITSLAMLLGYEPHLQLGILLYSLTFLLAALLMPLTTLLAANERFDLVATVQVLNQLVTIGVGLFFLLTGAGFLALVYTGFVAMPAQIAVAVWAVRRYRMGPLPLRIEPHTWNGFLRASLPFGITSLALTFNFHADTVILGMFHNDAVVGWYNAAYRLVFNLVSLSGSFLAVITPSLAREHRADPARVRSWTRASIRGLALPALPIAVGVSLLAQPIVQLLYGEPFAPAGLVLAIICWDVPLLLFTALCGNITAAVELERPAARIYLISAALNLVLNLALIPLFGMYAAAAITVVTDLVSAWLFFRLLSQRMQIEGLGRALLRTAAAAALMGVAVWLARPLPLPLVVAVGALTYGGLVLALGLIDLRVLVPRARQLLRR